MKPVKPRGVGEPVEMKQGINISQVGGTRRQAYGERDNAPPGGDLRRPLSSWVFPCLLHLSFSESLVTRVLVVSHFIFFRTRPNRLLPLRFTISPWMGPRGQAVYVSNAVE